MYSWNNGTIASSPTVLSSLNYSMHYANPVVWEGIRSYKQEDGSTKVFRLKDHIQRMLNSAKIMGFKIPFTLNQLVDACNALVAKNGGGDLYLRPIAYATGLAESAKPQKLSIAVDIYCFPIPPLHEGKPGAKCIVSTYKRGYPQFQMQAKTAANYGFLQLLKPEIDAAKVDDALLTDNNGYVVESTVSNFFIFKGDVALTPPNDGSILQGITRDTVGKILTDPTIMFQKHNKNPTLVEKHITRADIYTADCMILTGTYSEVVRVLEVDGREIGTDQTQEYFKMLKFEYSNIVRGRYGDYI